jgi:phosphate uptake regulator
MERPMKTKKQLKKELKETKKFLKKLVNEMETELFNQKEVNQIEVNQPQIVSEKYIRIPIDFVVETPNDERLGRLIRNIAFNL